MRRTVLPRPASGVAYELTDYGRDLEQAVVTLGPGVGERWDRGVRAIS